MSTIILKPFELHHIDRIQGWFEQSAADMLLKSPAMPVSQMSSHVGGPLAWVGIADGQVVAVAIIEVTPEHAGRLTFAVEPASRRQGIGRQLVEKVMAQPQVQSLRMIKVDVDPSNIAAQKIVERQGFTRTGYEPDGNIAYQFRM